MNRTGFLSAIAILVIVALPGPAPAQQFAPSVPIAAVPSAVHRTPDPAVVRAVSVLVVRADLSRHQAPAPTRQHVPMPFETFGFAAAALATGKRARKRASRADADGASGDVDTSDRPTEEAESTGPNTTDAEGVDSNWQPPSGVDPAVATPHTTPEVTDPGYKQRRAIEARARGEEILKADRNPQVLTGNYDVRRGEAVYRIPAGTVVEDAELTDDEWDHIVREKLVKEATFAEVQAKKRRAETAENDAKLLAAKKEQIGAKPKSSSGEKAPAGATLVADLDAGRAEVDRANAARSVARGEVVRATGERASMMSGKK